MDVFELMHEIQNKMQFQVIYLDWSLCKKNRHCEESIVCISYCALHRHNDPAILCARALFLEIKLDL